MKSYISKAVLAAALSLPVFAFANTVTTLNLVSTVPLNAPIAPSIKNVTSISYATLNDNCDFPNQNSTASNGPITSGSSIGGKTMPVYMCMINSNTSNASVKAAQYDVTTKSIQYFDADSSCYKDTLNKAIDSISSTTATLTVSLLNGKTHCVVSA